MMSNLKLGNLKIGARLVFGFGCVVVLLAITVIIGWSATNSAKSSARQSTADVRSYAARVRLADDAFNVSQYANMVEGDYGAHANHATEAGDEASTQAAISAFLADYATVSSESLSARQAALLRQARSAFDGYVSAYQEALSDLNRGTASSIATGEDVIVALDETGIFNPIAQLNSMQLDQLDKANAAAVSSAGTSGNLMIILGIVAILVAAAITTLIVRSITGPVRRAGDALRRVAAGDYTVSIDATGTDEVGDMSRALGTAVGSVRHAFVEIHGCAEALGSASEELASISQQMSGHSEETATQASMAAAAAEQISSNVGAVAASAEEMSASIAEIARSTGEATRVASDGVSVAEATGTTVQRLGESSSEIGEVLKAITSIAQQTNLLALNATIEAARAGEAGRGFAIVANEVKDLAKETAKATEDISAKVEAIQSDSHAAISAIGEIADIMGKINEAQGTIASAVEEQTATTSEIGRSVHEAATGSAEIARNVAGVAASAQEASTGAANSKQAAGELARLAGTLQQLLAGVTY
jgi:methyl-accepting chemotaxis protein